MKLLYIADGRSPIALNWIGYFVSAGHEVHLVSTFACSPDLPLASLHILPVAMSGMREPGGDSEGAAGASRGLRDVIPVNLRTALRRWVGPLTIPGASQKLRQIIAQIQPDLTHAMRIPFEGMLASQAMESLPGVPLVVSVWGNDFTLHAGTTPLMRSYTRKTLRRADALHADCQRDVRLARQWGFGEEKRAFVLPGGGGIQLDVFHPRDESPAQPDFRVINPRGVRAYIRNDTFFRAVPLVHRQHPQIRFICPAMSGESEAEHWLASLYLSEEVELLPRQSRSQMAKLFRQAQVVVSPSEHDGTPNTLLEAMACGCFPIVGDIESVREWIKPEVNGLLFDPDNPEELAEAILKAFQQPDLQRTARDHNLQLINERAEHQQVMRDAEEHYREIRFTGTGLT